MDNKQDISHNVNEEIKKETESVDEKSLPQAGESSSHDVDQAEDIQNGNEEQHSEEQCWEDEREELINQILRLKADFDNYRRRNQAQIESIRQRANEDLVAELLPIIDNFQRAFDSSPVESSFAKGVKMIFSQLYSCLCSYGLKPIDAVGTSFDPNIHEAVSMQGDSEQELIVTAEVQKGYLFKDKLLRASMVQVAPLKQQEEEDK